MRRTVGATLVVLSLSACTLVGPDGERTEAEPSASPAPPPEPLVAELRLPEAPVTVVPDPEASARAVATSEAFVTSSPAAVLAPADPAGLLRASSTAVALGVPVLLGDGPEVAAELERLGTEVVVSFLPPPARDPGDDGGTRDGQGVPDDGGAQDGDANERRGDDADGGAGATTGPVGADSADGAEGAEAGQTPAPASGSGSDLLDALESDGVEVVVAPTDEELAERLDLTDVVPVATGDEPAAVRGLDRAAPTLLVDAATSETGDPDPADPEAAGSGADGADAQAGPAETPGPGPSAGPTDRPEQDAGADAGSKEPGPDEESRLDRVEQAEPVTGARLLSTGAVDDVAAIATARAVGAEVVLVPGGDPRRHSSVVQALAGDQGTTVALGAEFGTVEDLTWKLATAATGVELPGGGQVLFPGRRLVALYGTPSTGALGVLGEQDVDGAIARVQKFVRAYRPLTEDTVVPAFEMIVTVASAEAGDDGNYSRELDPASFVPWIEAAQEAGVYVLLDLQPGRTDFLTQAEQYEQLLRYPHVGLALDPEWRLEPDQVHLRQIGSVDVAEVNAVGDWLAALTRENALPQKLFVLHQFNLRMIRDRHELDTSHPELATMIHADGQGSQPAKAGTWAALRRDAPDVRWGWKNFFDEDSPTLTPEQTYRISPLPELVTYQ